MARTQAPDYELRQEAILDLAARLFARVGFDGTSMSELAEQGGISKSLIYHYYKSKEDILYAVMASHVDQLIDDVTEVVAAGNKPRDALRALFRRFMGHYVGAAARQNVLLNELDKLPHARRMAIVRKQRNIIEAVQGLLTQIHPTLATDPVRARAQTMLVFGLINWTHTWFDPKGALNSDEVADIAFAMASAQIR